MIRLFTTLLAAQVVTAFAAGAPVKVWETEGFEAPESALYDEASRSIYVSNVAGEAPNKDGNGFISKLTADGKVSARKWVTGLDAPKGLALAGNKLYVSDIDKLVEIDVAEGKIVARHEAKDAKFLNDVVADREGRIYVSDMVTNVIWRLDGGKFEPWLSSAALKNPNGLLVEGDTLIVAAWGVMTDGFATKVPGNLVEVSLADKSVRDLGDGKPVGNLDGIEPVGDGSYLVTDWMAGKLFRFDAAGKSTLVLGDLGQGAADLGYIPAEKLAIIPRMKDGKVTAFKVE